ncbi:MAG: LysM peptidoglycan-binding domain-containing protein [Bacteroidota bacterium]
MASYRYDVLARLRRAALLPILWILLVGPPPVMAQETEPPSLQARPLQLLETTVLDTREIRFGDDQWTWFIDLPTDTLSEPQILQRIGRLYSYQARIMQAYAVRDSGAVPSLINEAMTDMSVLVQQPLIMENTRFREAYRSLITEYESFYGVPDTLELQHGDIFALRADAFEAMESESAFLLENAFPASIPPPVLAQTQVPMTEHPLVERSMAYLIRSAERSVQVWLRRADTYFPMIEQIFAEEGAPDELKYLAIVESGLNPRARSWAQASGMWQFMAGTGRRYGLDVSRWVDERRNPELATRAAAQHLNDLYQEFGDWHLALAAYNAGSGNVRKALRRARRAGRTQDFWGAYDYLPRETRNYVPMYIATALVVSNPEAYNLRRPATPGPRYEYDAVPIAGRLSVAELAELAGVSTTTIQALNPSLRRDWVPPSTGIQYVRIPAGRAAAFLKRYEELPEDVRRPATTRSYAVRRGDTLSEIARREGTTVRRIMQTNRLRNTRIRVGQQLTIPVPGGTVEAGRLPLAAEAAPRTVRYPVNQTRLIVRSEAPAPPAETVPVQAASLRDVGPAPEEPAPPQPETLVYRVRRGDTLSGIAQTHGVSVSDLKQWNNLRSSRIRAGQRLTIQVRQ